MIHARAREGAGGAASMDGGDGGDHAAGDLQTGMDAAAAWLPLEPGLGSMAGVGIGRSFGLASTPEERLVVPSPSGAEGPRGGGGGSGASITEVWVGVAGVGPPSVGVMGCCDSSDVAGGGASDA